MHSSWFMIEMLKAAYTCSCFQYEKCNADYCRHVQTQGFLWQKHAQPAFCWAPNQESIRSEKEERCISPEPFLFLVWGHCPSPLFPQPSSWTRWSNQSECQHVTQSHYFASSKPRCHQLSTRLPSAMFLTPPLPLAGCTAHQPALLFLLPFLKHRRWWHGQKKNMIGYKIEFSDILSCHEPNVCQ